MMKRKYAYDFVLSFAGEDRNIVEKVKQRLEQSHFKVFYDLDEKEVLLGKDLAEHFSKLYQTGGEYCVIFISQHYVRKAWCRWERRAALARAFKSKREYIIPYFLDDSRLSAIPETIGRAKFPNVPPAEFARLLVRKYYRESGSLELAKGIYIKHGKKCLTRHNPEILRHEGMVWEYGYGVDLNFSVVNATDHRGKIKCILGPIEQFTEFRRDINLAKIIHYYGPRIKALMGTHMLEFVPYSIIQAHRTRNLRLIFCLLGHSEADGDITDIEKIFGPPKVLSSLPEGLKGSEAAIRDVLKSLSTNNFEMFDGLTFEILVEYEFGREKDSVCIDATVHDNKIRFMNVRKLAQADWKANPSPESSKEP